MDEDEDNGRATAAGLRARLRSGAPCIGAWQMTNSTTMTAIMASQGVHWLVVDLEHSTISDADAESAFIVAERYGTTPLVRLPNADPYRARRLLDAGAQGLLIPTVEDADAFAEFASHCFYPPDGCRGLGLMRVNLWGRDLEGYFSNFRPILVPQIETLRGVERLEDILKVPGVEAIFIGPYDLSASLGIPGQFEDPSFREVLGRIHEACAAAGKHAGIHQVDPDLSKLRQRIEEGYSFIAYGTDTIAVNWALKGIDSLTD